MIYSAILFDYGGTLGHAGKQGTPSTGIPSFIPVLIRQLYECGYRLGIVSNSHRYGDARWLRQTMATADIVQYFEIIAGSGGMSGKISPKGSNGCHKPETEIYERVCHFLGVDYNQCLFVGDTWDADIAKPASLGMGTLLVNIKNDYSSDLWNVLKDKPENKRPNVISRYKIHTYYIHTSNVSSQLCFEIQCELREMNEPITAGDTIIVGHSVYKVDSVSFAHDKAMILDNSGDGRKILTITASKGIV